MYALAQDDDAALSSLRWRVPEDAARHWRNWGDEVVVYLPGAATTHLLDGNSAAVFLTLLESAAAPVSEEDLRALLIDSAEGDANTRLLRDILDSLQNTGLAESFA